MKNYKHLVRCIISKHTTAMIQSEHAEPETHQELYELMVEGCAFILTEMLLDDKLTPMEYNATRNELAKTLWAMFETPISAEWAAGLLT